jgi:isoleucyl-tRNA synthetase
VHAHYARYEFYKGINTLNKYISNDLSAFYFEALKDGIYTGAKEHCHLTQRALGLIFYELLKMLAPVTPLLVEEVWDHVPEALRTNTTHPARGTWTPLSTPTFPKELDMHTMHTAITTLSAAIKSAQEKLRADKKIGSPLESSVTLYLPRASGQKFSHLFRACTHASLSDTEIMEHQLAALFVVSEFRIRIVDDDDVEASEVSASGFDKETPEEWKEASEWCVEEELGEQEDGAWLSQGARVVVHNPSGAKCPRCWRFVKEEKEDVCGRCAGVIESEGLVV